jgi:GH24 family phage-related lysozyme (muramidase)
MAKIKGAKQEDGAPWTYGFGFTHLVTPDSRIEPVAAERRLESLILQMNLLLQDKLPWFKDASFTTKTVLINMAFNMGVRGLFRFKNTLAFIKSNQYEDAARNMKLSLWYSQVGSRAKELVERMRTQTIEPQHLPENTPRG